MVLSEKAPPRVRGGGDLVPLVAAGQGGVSEGPAQSCGDGVLTAEGDLRGQTGRGRHIMPGGQAGEGGHESRLQDPARAR